MRIFRRVNSIWSKEKEYNNNKSLKALLLKGISNVKHFIISARRLSVGKKKYSTLRNTLVIDWEAGNCNKKRCVQKLLFFFALDMRALWSRNWCYKLLSVKFGVKNVISPLHKRVNSVSKFKVKPKKGNCWANEKLYNVLSPHLSIRNQPQQLSMVAICYLQWREEVRWIAKKVLKGLVIIKTVRW